MKDITRQNWKVTSFNKKGDTRRINITRSTPAGKVQIKGFIKNNYVTDYTNGSISFVAPGYINSTSVELFDMKRGDFDRMFGWTEKFLRDAFNAIIK